MARVKDLWFSDVPVKDPTGKTAKHPDMGGNKDAKRWLACWINPDGKEDTRAFAKQAAAKSYADKMEADAERGEYVDPAAGKEKFGALAVKYLRLRAVGASSRTRYESVYRNHVEAAFAHRAVKAPRPSDIVEWLRGPVSKLTTPGPEGPGFPGSRPRVPVSQPTAPGGSRNV